MATGAMLAAVQTVPAAAGPAIGQFEVKQVHTEAGDIELQSQNAYTFGNPRRRVHDHGGGDYDYDGNSVAKARNAIELEYSWTDWLRTRIGIEYEKERIDDPSSPAEANSFANLKLDEYQFEAIVVLMPIKGDGFGAAWLTEYEIPAERGEQMTLIMGPLFEARQGAWRALLNLYMVNFIGGEQPEDGKRDDKWDFAYAAQVKYEYSKSWSLAVEAYGTVERVGNTGAPDEEALLFGDANQHRIGPVVYYELDLGKGLRPAWMGEDEGAEASFGVGLLAGLTEETPDATLKLSLEIDF
jgi:hypothetical protein